MDERQCDQKEIEDLTMKRDYLSPRSPGRAFIRAGAVLMLLLTDMLQMASVGLADTPVKDGLVGLWEGENNALDTSGRGNDGTLVGGVAFAPGVVGQAFDFRGSLRYVRVPDHPSLDGFTEATWSFWVKLPNPTGSLMGFMDKRTTAGTNNAYTIFVNDGSMIYGADFGIELGNASGGWSYNGAAIDRKRISSNTWHHIAISFDMGAIPNFAFYVDAIRCPLTALGTNLNGPIFDASAPLVIGAVNSGTMGGVQGLMDQVALYNRVLTPTEIARLAGMDPAIITQPLSRTNIAGATTSFIVGVLGTAPLSHQWRLEGTNLVEGGRLSGVTTTNLLVANVHPADAGGYSVVVTNAYGSVTSSVAQLTVITPGRFSNLAYSPAMGFSFTFGDAIVGRPYRIQRSPSMAEGSWSNWQSLTYTEPIFLTDMGATGLERRFYRAVSP